jgi:hypothetical protein
VNAGTVKPLTRGAFDQQRAAAKRVSRQHGRALVLFSVGLGLVQLLFLRWAEGHLARAPRLAIAGSAFLAYVALIGVLLWRMERRLGCVRPTCPQCGVALKDLSERVQLTTVRAAADAERPGLRHGGRRKLVRS